MLLSYWSLLSSTLNWISYLLGKYFTVFSFIYWIQALYYCRATITLQACHRHLFYSLIFPIFLQVEISRPGWKYKHELTAKLITFPTMYRIYLIFSRFMRCIGSFKCIFWKMDNARSAIRGIILKKSSINP